MTAFGAVASWKSEALMADSGTSAFGMLRGKADADLGTPFSSV
jgi:hypothetical protein